MDARVGRVRRTARALAFAGIVAGGCVAGARPKAPSPAAPPEPSWADAFRPAPPILLAFHPRLLEADPLYGPLLRKALALARLRSPMAAAIHALDAVEDADEVVCGLRPLPGEPFDSGDLLVAIVGVRADIDPEALVDTAGHRLWSPGPPGRVRELVRTSTAEGAEAEASGGVSGPGERVEPDAFEASLFELPGRAWVIASGREATRTRDTFARAEARPPVLFDEEALAQLRIDGPSLGAHVPFLRGASALAPIGRKLREVDVTLGGREGHPESEIPSVGAVFTYADAGAAAASRAVMRDAVAAIARKRPDGLAWLAGLVVTSAGRDAATDVVLSLPLPAELLAALRSAAEPPGFSSRRSGNTAEAPDGGGPARPAGGSGAL
ncbi:MAG: hypothetical protein FWD17_00280 [Polyangiaceae bacterium]|nr:hypothetical protein [Polyangiaceae bacterium]